MKIPSSKNPRSATIHRRPAAKGFTLMETVIAIGVLAVLLTGFIAVFTPAAQGIRRSISAQQADRLASTLEQELVTLRDGQKPTSATTGFEKAFDWIQSGNTAASAIFVYQYRGDSTNPLRSDGTPKPLNTITGQPGKNYVVQSMARRLDDPLFKEDLKAIEGSIFFVKPTQLVYDDSQMVLNNDDFKNGAFKPIAHINTSGTVEKVDTAVAYNDAVIAFSAEFHSVPTKAEAYLIKTGSTDPFGKRFNNAKRPVFTRNLAVRR